MPVILWNNRTMSLHESGDSSGAVSLSGMFEGAFGNVRTGEVRLPTLAQLIARGGWPELLCVLVGLSSYAYRREDGVYVVPITALRDRWRRGPVPVHPNNGPGRSPAPPTIAVGPTKNHVGRYYPRIHNYNASS